MSVARPAIDVHLLFSKATRSGHSYRVSAYTSWPAAGAPVAIDELRPLDRWRPERRPGLAARAERLARWVFFEPMAEGEDAQEPPRLNPIGAFLAGLPVEGRRGVKVHWQEPWMEQSPELVTMPLTLLELNTLLPVTIIEPFDEPEGPIAPSLVVPSGPLEVRGKLRVLIVYANPAPVPKGANPTGHQHDYPHLPGLPAFFDRLKETLDSLIHDESIVLDILEQPTPQELLERLTRVNPHVLVYLGHGAGPKPAEGWKPTGKRGLVCVADGAPAIALHADIAAAVRLAPEPALRLAVLIACHSARAWPHLRAAGVPAVLAMRDEFDANSVPAFARAFFGALARFEPLRQAHAAAFDAVEAGPVPRDALLMKLSMATDDDRLFASSVSRFVAEYRQALGDKEWVKQAGYTVAATTKPVYINRDFQRKVEEREAEDPGVALKREAREATEKLVPVEFWRALEEERRLLVVAPAWTGKSTLCGWVTRQFLERTGERRLPVLIEFAKFARSGKSIERYLTENYLADFGLEGRTIEVEHEGVREKVPAGTWLHKQWLATRVLLILDGADEVSEPKVRADAVNRIPTQGGGASCPLVLLTSRPDESGNPSGFHRVDLKPLAPQAIQELVERCAALLGNPAKATGFLERLNAPDAVAARDLAGRPGHLVQMVAAFVRKDVFAAYEDDVLELALEHRLAITGRVKPSFTHDPLFKRRVLEELAFHIQFCRRGQPVDHATMVALTQDIMQRVSDYLRSEAVTLLVDLVRNSGFLRQSVAGPSFEYALESRPWREYLAACHLGREIEVGPPVPRGKLEPKKGGAANLREWALGVGPYACPVCRGIKPSGRSIEPLPSSSECLLKLSWHPVVVNLAGVLDDATGLLNRLAREPDDLFGRMLELRAQVLARARQATRMAVRITARQILSPWEKPDYFPRRMSAYEKLKGYRVRWNGKHQDGGWAPIDGLLRIAVNGTYWDTRVSACEALGALGDRRAVDGLLRIAENHPPESTRVSAWEALGRLGDARAVDGLLRIAEHDADWYRQKSAWEALGRLGDVRAVDGLLRVAENHADGRTRAHACDALGALGDVRAVDGLLRVAEHDAHQSTRVSACEALESLGDVRAVDGLLRIAEHDAHQYTRVSAWEALGRLGDVRAVDGLLRIAEHDADQWTRESACETLNAFSEKQDRLIIRGDARWR